MTHALTFQANIDYLLYGDTCQQHAYHTLQKLDIFSVLSEFSPVLVGTVPIDIYIQDSDLDIICEVYHFTSFQSVVTDYFQKLDNFSYAHKVVADMPRAVVNFNYNGWAIQLFAQSIPAVEQNGFKHMVIEYRILQFLGEDCKQHIRALKLCGMKTEPAFAELLQLTGDPYEALLELYAWSDERLAEFCNREGRGSFD